ncbi:MAG: hypothetical protein R3B70_41335, partial [Polyangiaceae bacterium]
MSAPPVVRARVVPANGESVDPSRVLFVKGHVGDGHVRQVENDDVSQALSERVVPAVTWSLADGSVVIAPSVVLEPGETYGVLSGEPPLGVDVRVAKNDSVPVLRRAWPPPEAPAPAPFAIFCGDSALASPPSVVPVSPGEAPARLRRGVFHEIGDSC